MSREAIGGKLKCLFDRNPQLLIVIAIAIVSFIIFYVLFQQVSSVEYLREIIAALIATILTVTITTLLLKSQTDSEEAKERNVEILRRKIDSYNVFIDSIIDSMDDDDVTAEEAKVIRKHVYHLSLFSAAETVETVVKFVRWRLLDDVDESSFIDVVQAFREELKLDTSDELLGSDLEAVDKLITFGFANRDAFLAIRDHIDEMNELIAKSAIAGDGTLLDVGKPCGSLSGLAFTIDGSAGVQHLLQIDYPEDHEFSEIDLWTFLDLSEAETAIAPDMETVALGRGYVWDEGNGDEDSTTGAASAHNPIKEKLLMKRFVLKCRANSEGRITINGKVATKEIIEDINAMERRLSAAVKDR